MIIVPGNKPVRSIGSHVSMAAGLVAGLALGSAAVVTQSPVLLALSERWLRPFGTLFLNLLSMVVTPLVVAALFTGVAGLGDVRRLGRLGVRTLGFFWGTTLVAIVIGFAVAALVLPLGSVTPEQQAALRAAAPVDSSVVRAAEQLPGGARFLVELIPANPVRAAVDGNLLPLIVFTTICAIATAALPDEKRRVLTELAEVTTQALIRIVHWVLLIAPLGICALVAGAVATFGPSLLKAMGVFVLAVVTGLAVFIAFVYLPAVALVARIGALRFLRAIRASALMAFSTTSSLASLPVMLDAAGSDFKISLPVASFVLPLGASIGRAGSALFQAVAVLFVAQLYGNSLGFGSMVQAGAAVFLTSVTVASVPSASIVSLAPAFASSGLPLAGLPLLLGLDRIPDMFRTMTNVIGDMSAVTVVAAAEGEALE